MQEANPRLTLRRPADAGVADVPTDADLLRRFATTREEAAFALLVQRHGPLVLSVCRRVLGPVPDAEDAFQATFLVLARKAGVIRDPSLLGNWLYGVASRIARKARAGLSKRQMHEKQVQLLPSLQAPPSVEPDDLSPVLDEELNRLPEKYRAALVLCYLQGKTNEEAAQLLHWPTGTVKGRLARARELLRNRLIRRGWQASALALVALLSASRAQAGTLPTPLAHSTTQAAVGFAGGAKGAVAASPQAIRLAENVLKVWRPARLAALILVVLIAATGVASWIVGSGAIGGESNSSAGFFGGESHSGDAAKTGGGGCCHTKSETGPSTATNTGR